jgi:hypothetical protein
MLHEPACLPTDGVSGLSTAHALGRAVTVAQFAYACPDRLTSRVNSHYKIQYISHHVKQRCALLLQSLIHKQNVHDSRNHLEMRSPLLTTSPHTKTSRAQQDVTR